MNQFENLRFQCFLGIKAYQNVRAAHQAFERLCDLTESEDFLLLSGIFHLAIVRYAKPFVTTRSEKGQVRYKLRHLKKEQKFKESVHDHLLVLRNTLIAHDDFDQVEPRVLAEGMTLKGTGAEQIEDSGYFIPMSVTVSNKCISHPANLGGASKFFEHTRGTLSGIKSKLYEDLGDLRQAFLDFPEQAEVAKRYQRTVEENIEIPSDGRRLVPPDLSDDPWLNTPEPDFSDIHSGFRYETLRCRRAFHGHQKIKLPSGGWVQVKP